MKFCIFISIFVFLFFDRFFVNSLDFEILESEKKLRSRDLFGKKSISLNLKPSGNAKPHKPEIANIVNSIKKAISKDFNKNFVQANSKLKTNSKSDGDEQIYIEHFEDYYYMACIDIGTYKISKIKDEEFCVLLDTGSADLQVLDNAGSFKSKDVNRTMNSLYNINNSLTGHRSKNPRHVVLEYMKGRIVGLPTYDEVKIGDEIVYEQGFLSAIEMSAMTLDTPKGVFDGILGLAFQDLAASKFKPLIDNLYDSFVINKRRFSFNFTHDGNGNRFIIGDSDESYMTHGTTKVAIQPSDGIQGFQRLGINSVDIKGGKNDGKNVCEDCDAILDTGTSQMAVPIESYSTICDEFFLPGVKIVDGEYDYTNPENKCFYNSDYGVQYCKKSYMSQLPDLTFTFHSEVFSLEPKNYMDEMSYQGHDFVIPRMFPVRSKGWILGLPFLEKVYTTFDYTDKRRPYVLFANPKPYNPSNDETMYSKTKSTQIMIGSIFAGLLLFIAIIFGIILFVKLRKNKKQALIVTNKASTPSVISPNSGYNKMEDEESVASKEDVIENVETTTDIQTSV